MVEVVCAGSSCRMRGFGKIVRKFASMAAEKGLGDKVSLSGSFCAGGCANGGVSAKVSGDLYFAAPGDREVSSAAIRDMA